MARTVRMTRTAISPRLAIKMLSNTEDLLAESRIDTAHSHPEDAVADRLQRGVGGGGQGQAEHLAGVGGVDHAVVPEACGRVVRVALVLVLVADRRLERLFVFHGPLLATALELVAPEGGAHAPGRLAAHHGDPRVRPHPQDPRRIRAPAHRVVARAERAADDD